MSSRSGASGGSGSGGRSWSSSESGGGAVDAGIVAVEFSLLLNDGNVGVVGAIVVACKHVDVLCAEA